MAMIISVFTNMALYLASVCMLWWENRWREYLPQMIVNWAISLPVALLALSVLALIVLHFFLICKGMTTFDYIIGKRNSQVSPIQMQTHTNLN
jgi:hypothetical protein